MGLKIKIKVSIVIVTANRKNLFERCLLSLGSSIQYVFPGLADFEFLIVANGSGDYVPEVAKQALANIPYQVFEIADAISPGAARNRALAEASGDWIFFADDDIFVDSGFFESFLLLTSQRSDFAVLGGPNLTPESSNLFQKLSGHVLASYFTSFYCARRYRLMDEVLDVDESALTLCNLFVKRSAIGQLRFSKSLVCAEENRLLREMASQNHRFISHPDLKVFHERRDSFKSFCSQIANYGYGRGQLVWERKIQWFHFVPVTCLILLLSALLFPVLRPAVFGLAAIYFVLLIVSAQKIINLNRRPQLEILKIMFLISTVHFQYGMGFVNGVFNARKINGGLRRN